MERGTLRVDGAELAYVREGQGPPLLVVGSATYYPKAFSRGLRKHFELIFADSRHFVPNYVPDESAGKLTVDQFADDVESVRRQLGLERMAVLGHSVHAQIALAYARVHPERTSHLVLVGGVPYAFSEFQDEAAQFFDAEASTERKTLLANGEAELEALLAAAPPTRSFAVSYQARGPLYWADPAYDASSLLEGLENGPAFDHLFAAVPSKAEVRRTLEQVDIPILVVLGKRDFAIPYRQWEELLEGLDNVTYVLLEDDSHNPQTESPERFDPKLLEWFTSH
jgi:proline iminopeptidase